MKTARFIESLDHWKSDARLYELSEPMQYKGLQFKDQEDGQTKFVIVSAVIAPFYGPETYIFPATKDGQAINHLKMEGSFRGDLDHRQALLDAGFDIIE
ncbi:MAG: hypothetical protein ACW97P_09420 [Candidatus Hodarchaeales archaeon]|jgi:hypothetical protein